MQTDKTEALRIALVQLGEHRDGMGPAHFHAVNIVKEALGLPTSRSTDEHPALSEAASLERGHELHTTLDEETVDTAMLAILLARRIDPARPRIAAIDAVRLASIGRRLTRNGIDRCNHGDTPARSEQFAKLDAKATKIAGWYGLTADCSGDPRGSVLRLEGDGIPSNNMGGGFAL